MIKVRPHLHIKIIFFLHLRGKKMFDRTDDKDRSVDIEQFKCERSTVPHRSVFRIYLVFILLSFHFYSCLVS